MSPVDRGRSGSKHHLICDAGGIPLAVSLTGGNRDDITQLIPLVDAIPPIRVRRGRPRRRPRELFADRGSGLGRTAGWSSVASLGCTPSSGCAPATNAAPASTSACFSCPAP